MSHDNVCHICHHLGDIRKSIKMQKCDLDNGGQDGEWKKLKLHNSMWDMRFKVDISPEF